MGGLGAGVGVEAGMMWLERGAQLQGASRAANRWGCGTICGSHPASNARWALLTRNLTFPPMLGMLRRALLKPDAALVEGANEETHAEAV